MLQVVSALMRRGHDVLFVMCDNEAAAGALLPPDRGAHCKMQAFSTAKVKAPGKPIEVPILGFREEA
jgi:hypothetical protein